jgi:hypothetical protein
VSDDLQGILDNVKAQAPELRFVGLCHVLLPASLVHVNTAFGTVINTNPRLFATDRTFHDLPPPLSFFPDPEGLGLLPFSSRESVT